MFFLASQFREFLIIAIIAVIIISAALVIYYIVTGRKNKTEIPMTYNFENNKDLNHNNLNSSNTNEHKQINEVSTNENLNVQSKILPDEKKDIEDKKTDMNIQTLLNQMQNDLNKANETYTESINRYEDEEEENAIISYKELMKYKESHDKNIVLEEKNKEEIKEVIKEKEIEPTEEIKKFKRSEFISPIFGYNDETNVTYREIKRPPRKEVKIPDSENEWESDRMLRGLEDEAAEVIEFEKKENKPEEKNKNDSFLDALVDFRKKLN